MGINLSLTLYTCFSISLGTSPNCTPGPSLSASEGPDNGNLLRVTGQQEAPLGYVHAAWIQRKAGANVFREGKHERKTVLEKRGVRAEDGVRERREDRQRRRNSFPCTAIYNLFHHMSLVYSFN